MLSGTSECPDCGLIFSRFDIATNKEAKAKKLRGDRSYIINSNKLPSDVSFVKLLLLSIFTGVFGGHCFYVGKYLRGSVLLTNMVAMVLTVIFNEKIMLIGDGSFLATISTIYGLIEILWFYDVFAIITKRFKVPVAIDLEGEMLKQKKEYLESLNEIEIVSNENMKQEDGQLNIKHQTNDADTKITENKPNLNNKNSKDKIKKKQQKKK